MKRNWSKPLALILALLVTASCGRQEQPSPDEDEDTTPLGRYVEEQLELPREVVSIKKLEQAEDGALYLFANTGVNTVGHDYPTVGPWGLWRSGDDGSTWEQLPHPWLDELEGAAVANVALGPGSVFYIYAYSVVSPEEWMRELEEAADAREQAPEEPETDWENDGDEWEYDEEDWEYEEASHYFFARAREGALEPLPYRLPPNLFGNPIPSDIVVADNGDLLLIHYGQVLRVDAQTGTTMGQMEDLGLLLGGDMVERDGVLYLSNSTEIALYDGETGEELGEVVAAPRREQGMVSNLELQYGHRVLAAGEDGAVYYCDDSGLYRTTPNSPVTEQLLDGERCSLNMPSMVPHRLFVLSGDRYLVQGENGAEGTVLYRYRYDEDTPIEPSVQLRVYSLRDNPTIRQTMALFQRENPQVKVRYTVGMEGDSAATADDALRVLATELVAGSGPDVLVVDGLPTGNYIAKGVLLDLSPAIDPLLREGMLLENILGAYRQADGALYAVPARFTVPMLLAPDSAAPVNGLPDLVDWMKEREGAKLKYAYPSALLEQFYNVEEGNWIRQDGSFDGEAFRGYLEAVRWIIDQEAGETEEVPWAEEYSDIFDMVAWSGELFTAHMGELPNLFGAAVAWGAIDQRGEGVYLPLGRDRGGLYLPGTALAVNAAGAQTEMALAFVTTAFSEQVQANDFEDGIPVHRRALERGAQNPYPDYTYVGGYMTYWDGEDAQMDLTWPEEARFQEFMGVLAGLSQPVFPDETVRGLVLEQAKMHFYEDKSMEDTLRDLEQRLNLILAEQE